MKTILILLDTVRKDYLNIYNPSSDVKTPNIDMLANDSNIFCNHYTGSLPCMPARRDLFTGRLDFLERFWGGLEPFDIVLQKELSENGIKTHISTDHQHYWKFGGEGYLQYFDTYEMIRGQESDSWISSLDNYQKPDEIHGRYNFQYEKNKSKFTKIEDFPTIKTFDSAIEFIDANKNCENFYLQVEGFDPHEPFHVPKEYLEMYGINDIDEFYNSPKYGICEDTEEELEHITKKYKANLSFADYGLGKFISHLKKLKIYDECNIIFTSDHGFHFGEHGVLGKGINHIYNEISTIPLIHKLPFQKDQYKYEQLTQNIDIMPTVLNMYDIDLANYNFHGQSYLNLLVGEKYEARQSIISGYHGQSTMITNGMYTLYQAPINEYNIPLSHYTAMPTMIKGMIGSKYAFLQLNYDEIEMGRFLPHTKYPVFKYCFAKEGFKSPMLGDIFTSELYANNDFEQLKNLITNEKNIVLKMRNKLKEDLIKYEAPEEQFIRLGLK